MSYDMLIQTCLQLAAARQGVAMSRILQRERAA
jgi:hypothetical protein